ncbi:MAG: cytidine deaminase [Anaerolineaceae bacterium]|nr:cytidine deaminase [Anaerolineaceae bacterium]
MISEEKKQQLGKLAAEMRSRSYIPYSHYAVGAALLTKSGQIFTGCNIENAAYPVTVCAERTAIFKAVSEGEKDFSAIAVATDDGKGFPCGSCRQVMAEFSLDMEVFLCDADGNITSPYFTVRDLLPGAFTPENLAEH